MRNIIKITNIQIMMNMERLTKDNLFNIFRFRISRP